MTNFLIHHYVINAPHQKRSTITQYTSTMLFHPSSPKLTPQLVIDAAFIAMMRHDSTNNGTMHHSTKFPQESYRVGVQICHYNFHDAIQVNIPFLHASEVSCTSRQNNTLATVSMRYIPSFTKGPLTKLFHGLLHHPYTSTKPIFQPQQEFQATTSFHQFQNAQN